MSGHPFILEAYKGKATRHTCPQCGEPHKFTRYVVAATGQPIADHIGRCDRECNCGYHYTPKQYFADGGTRPADGIAWQRMPEPPPRPPYLHDRAEVRALLAHPERNTLSAYWQERIGADRWDEVAKAYALGTWQDGRLAGAAVYWQVDIHGNVKAGKIMQYDPYTGKRSKEERTTSWVHFMRTRQSAGELNVEQCLFGEHLLKSWPMDHPVAVVESEKTAMIAAALVPSVLWLATGAKGEFKQAKLQALTGRKVLAYPDLSPNSATYYEWKERAEAMKPLFASIHVADILEAMATAKDMEEGLDIGDHLLRSDVDTPKASTSAITTESAPPPPILSRAEGGVERMAAKNPSINLLVELLQLDGANATVYQWKQHSVSVHV